MEQYQMYHVYFDVFMYHGVYIKLEADSKNTIGNAIKHDITLPLIASFLYMQMVVTTKLN